MNTLFDILAGAFVLIGLFFFALGAIGVVRMPDAYHRLHAATKCSTLGLVGLLAGVAMHLGSAAADAKLLIVLLFAFVAGPVGSHMLAKAALHAGNRQWPDTLSDEHAEDAAE